VMMATCGIGWRPQSGRLGPGRPFDLLRRHTLWPRRDGARHRGRRHRLQDRTAVYKISWHPLFPFFVSR